MSKEIQITKLPEVVPQDPPVDALNTGGAFSNPVPDSGDLPDLPAREIRREQVVTYDEDGRVVVIIISDEDLENPDSFEKRKEHVLNVINPKRDSNTPVITIKGDEVIHMEDKYGSYMDAWELKSGKIKINTKKSKDIHLEHIREIRNIVLEKRDQDMLIALGKNNTAKVAELESEKQVLRDLPATVKPAIKKAKTFNDVKMIMPPELLG
tara:strand:- start:5319 stop:5948 length:630 start_codon:yes stop_codon:yes gene_type:complete